MKRSKVEMQSVPSPVPNAANRGRVRRPPMIISPSPPVNIYPSQSIHGTLLSKKPMSGGSADDDQGFSVDFDRDELSATVLCCDYPECQAMGALQKDYLRDHYMTYHNESLVKPSVMIPPTYARTHSRSMRCSACLRKLMDENQGRTCDNCQRFEPIYHAAVRSEPNYMNGLEGMALGSIVSIHVLNRIVPTDASTSPSGPWPEAVESRIDALTNDEPSESSIKEEEEQNPPSEPSFWTPPEIPQHW
jgi:hypothetical protein